MVTYKSIKIGKNLYEARNPKRRIKINAYQNFNVIHHKGRWIIALTETNDDWRRVFKSCHTINRTQALQMISFLSDYVNLVKPIESTALNASLKASTNRIVKTGQELTAIAIRSELEATWSKKE